MHLHRGCDPAAASTRAGGVGRKARITNRVFGVAAESIRLPFELREEIEDHWG